MDVDGDGVARHARRDLVVRSRVVGVGHEEQISAGSRGQPRLARRRQQRALVLSVVRGDAEGDIGPADAIRLKFGRRRRARRHFCSVSRACVLERARADDAVGWRVETRGNRSADVVHLDARRVARQFEGAIGREAAEGQASRHAPQP